jgi:hypothetical protein
MNNRILLLAIIVLSAIPPAVRSQNDSAAIQSASLDSASCSLSISSEPSDAAVYLDSVLVGRTPVVLNNLEEREYSLIIMHHERERWISSARAVRGKLITVAAILPFRKGYLIVNSAPVDAEFYLDGQPLIRKSSNRYEVVSGNHEVEVRSNSLQRSAKQKIYISVHNELGLEADIGYHSSTAPLFSLLLPGLGQIYEGSIYEGAAYAAGAAGLVLFSAVRNTDYQRTLAAYRISHESYLNAYTEPEINRFRGEMIGKKSIADRSYRYRTVAYSAVIGLYLYNVIDAILFHSLDDRIRAIQYGKSTQSSYSLLPDRQQIVCGFSIKL